jgi:glutaredoxin 3
MSETRITVYTGPFCGYCEAAKRMLRRLEIPFEAIDLGGQPERRMKLVEETGWRTVPIILLDDKLIGGYTELMALHRSGGLNELLPD